MSSPASPPHRLSGLAGAAAALACAAGLGIAPPAQAERADRNKPMTVDADAARYDDLKQVGTFTGNVQVTKGTIQMRADRIEVRQTPDGYQVGVLTGSADKPASFRQKREGVDETIEGIAERIEYDSKADTVRFVGNAVIRRWRGSTVADETAGNVITYDNIAEVFSVAGGRGTPGSTDGRVRAVLTPRESAPAASAPPASAPGGPR